MNKRIATLGAVLFTVIGMGSTGAHAASLDSEKYFTVSEVELFEMVDGHEMFVDRQAVESAEAPAAAGPGPGTIIQIGKKIWEVIAGNRPVSQGDYPALSALPAGTKSWDELQDWSEPVLKTYKIVYKNHFKQKVVEFEYHIAFTPNGSYKGVGKYLSRVEIEPKILNVAWGYKFNVSGAILSVTNAGTEENPIAAMELNMNWSISTLIKNMGQSVRYYIRGDGLFKNLTDGTIATN